MVADVLWTLKMSESVTLYGGPMDGKTIPPAMAVIDWLAFKVVHGNNNQITYIYEYNETTDRFEFVGEDSEEDSE